MASSDDDVYNIRDAIRRRLYDEWFKAWVGCNDARCARLIGEWPDWIFDSWTIRPPKRGAMPTMFHPLSDRVLIKPESDSGEKRTPSGLIILPDLGKTRSNTGFIAAIGPDCEDLEIGDKVLFGKYAGADIELNGEEMVICRVDDILGVITEEPDEDSIDESPGEPDPQP